MANGRALPTALLFDTLLGRAWDIALANYGNAQSIENLTIPDTLSTTKGEYSINSFRSSFNTDEVRGVLNGHDNAVRKKLEEVAALWADEFKGIIEIVAPIGPGFHAAVAWLRKVANGGDGLGYVGQDHRNNQLARFTSTALGSSTARGLPMPPGAAPALQAVAGGITGLYADRLRVQMDADREAARHKLQIDAVVTLVELRNAALDAAMEYVFGQMNMMFDVFGQNNDYLTKIRRDEQAMQARMAVRSAELARWDESLAMTNDSYTDAHRKVKALNDRYLEIMSLEVEQRVKRLRRYSSQVASALNSAGVSVSSQASESNTVDAEE